MSKKLTFFLQMTISLIVLLTSFHASSQYKFEFESTNREFNSIMNMDEENLNRLTPLNDTWSGDEFALLSLDFEFKWGEYSFDSMILIFEGHFFFQPDVCQNFDYSFNMGFMWGINDPTYFNIPPVGFSDTALGGIFQTTTGPPGQRKYIVEWFNAGGINVHERDTISFQIIFYENQPLIEYHFDKVKVSNETWNSFDFGENPKFGFTPIEKKIDCNNDLLPLGMLHDHGTSPVFLYLEIDPTSGIMPPEMGDSTLISPPSPGTLWQFKLEKATMVDNPILNEGELSVYPNPSSTGVFQIEASHDINHIELHEIATGKKIPVNHHNNSNIHIYQTGVYLLTVVTDTRIYRKKLVVTH